MVDTDPPVPQPVPSSPRIPAEADLSPHLGLWLLAGVLCVCLAAALFAWLHQQRTQARAGLLLAEAAAAAESQRPQRALDLYQQALAMGAPPTVELYRSMARSALDLAPPDMRRALDLLERASALDPSDADLHLELAERYLQSAQPLAALQHARSASETAPDRVDAWERLAHASRINAQATNTLLDRTRFLTEAARALERQSALDPSRPEPYLQLLRVFAELASSMSDPEGYEQLADEVVAALENALQPLAEELARAREASPGEPLLLCDQATLALLTGDAEGARTSLQELLAHPTHAAWAGTLLGWVQANSGDLVAAEATLRQTLAAETSPILAWIRMAQVLRQQGRHADAAALLSQRAVTEPSAPELFVEWGRAAVAGGRAAEVGSIGRALRLRYPGHGWAELLEGETALSEGDPARALPLLETARAQAAGEVRSTHLMLADTYRRLNRREEARASLAAALERWPHSAQLHGAMAGINLDLGRREEAVSHGREALRLDPASVAGARAAARALLAMGQFDEARTILNGLKASRPTDPRPLLLLAEVESAAGQLVQALAQIEHASHLPVSPALTEQIRQQQQRLQDLMGVQSWEQNFHAALAARQMERAREILRGARGSLGAAATVQRAEALLLLARGRAREAAERLDRLVRTLTPPDSATLFYLAEARLAAGQPGPAATAAEAARQLNPEHLESVLLLAEAREGEGRPDLAEALLREAMAAHPEEVGPTRSLGLLLARTGHETEAVALLQDAHQRDPADAAAGLALAELLHRSGSAEAAFEVVLEIQKQNPANIDLALSTAATLWQMGRTAEADAAHDRALAAVGQTGPALALSSVYYERTGRPRLALEQCRRALEQDPINVGLLRRRGAMAARYGTPAESVESYRKAAQLAPDDVGIPLEFAGILDDVGLPAEAGRVLRTALTQFPSSPDLRIELARLLGKTGLVEQALEQLRLADETAPDRTPVLLRRGEILLAQAAREEPRVRELRQALSDLAAVPESSPLLLASRFLAARIYFQLGEPENCLRMLDQAVANPLSTPEPTLKLIEYRTSRMEWDEVRRLAERVIAESPAHPGTWLATAEAAIQEATLLAPADPRRDALMARASERIERARALLPSDHPQTALATARLLWLREGAASALDYLRSAPESVRHHEMATAFLATLLVETGDARGAVALLEEAVADRRSIVALDHAIRERQRLALDPSTLLGWLAERPEAHVAANHAAWTALEICLVALQGDCPRAAAMIQTLTREPLPTAALLPLARAEIACQRSEAALDLLRAALRRDPYDVATAELLVRQLRLRANTADEIRRITRRVRGLYPQALAEL